MTASQDSKLTNKPKCYCSTLTITSLTQESGTLITDDLIALKESAEHETHACPFCQICWAAMKERYPRHYRGWLRNNVKLRDAIDEKKPLPKFQGWESGIVVKGRFTFCVGDDGDHESGGEKDTQRVLKGGSCIDISPLSNDTRPLPPSLGVFAMPGSIAAKYIPERFSASNAINNEEACLEQIRTWIHECTHNHEKCKSLGVDCSPMPSRIIDISEILHPRLIISNGQLGKYMALSYCWGPPGEDMLTLTTQTLPSLLRGSIEEGSFIKTHQEAFQLARSFGIQYVWIDALCILQDDYDDWAVESRRMGDIYGNAYVTVVAGSSADARKGFRQDRGTLFKPFPIPLTSEDSSPFLFATLFPSLKEGPTASRGWCFQEAMLSKRSVVFGSEQMSFRCSAGTVYEFQRKNVISLLELGKITPQALAIFRPEVQLTNLSEQQKRFALLQHWYMMLREFSGRHFTTHKDLFASISSLAQKIEVQLGSDGGRYLAGIWEVDLVRGLLWRARYKTDEPAILTRPILSDSTTRAPSWSWAAVHGSIDNIDFEPVGWHGHAAVRDSTAETNLPDGVWIKNSAFSSRSDFLRIKPGIEVTGSSNRLWTHDQTCGTEVLNMPFCELRVLGRLKRGTISSEKVNIRRWKPKHQWRPSSQQYNMMNYDGFRPRFEDALSIYCHGAYVNDIAGPEHAFAVAAFDIMEEACEDVWCLQVTEVEGLLLHLDPQCGDDTNSVQRYKRLGLFWMEDITCFDSVGEVEVCLI